MSAVPPDPARAQELAAEVAKITDAVDAARGLLDFNDEPARFFALLESAVAPGPQRK
jgi:hypothetical protein